MSTITIDATSNEHAMIVQLHAEKSTRSAVIAYGSPECAALLGAYNTLWDLLPEVSA